MISLPVTLIPKPYNCLYSLRHSRRLSGRVNVTFYEKLSFNFIRDIAPVAGIMRVPNVMVVNPSVPAKTAPEFIAYAKANPGEINMASAGNGASDHMSGELSKC